MTTFTVGDRVRVKPTAFRSGHEGELIGVEPGIYTHTIRFTNGGVHTYKACELERIDDEPAMPAGVARSPNDHTGGAGSEAEPAEAPPSPALLYSLLVAQAQAIAQLRGESGFLTNRIQELDHQIATSQPSASEVLDVSESFSRRMRINITKNTKGYNHDLTFEIIATDPRTDLQREMADGLRLAGRLARQAITEAEYTDEHGQPGAEPDGGFDDVPFS